MESMGEGELKISTRAMLEIKANRFKFVVRALSPGPTPDEDLGGTITSESFPHGMMVDSPSANAAA
jgi:hypothetical protein